MNLAQFKAAYSEKLRQATWCIPLRGKDEVLLAMKKRGFGAGLWNASGGKVKPGEDIKSAAAREIYEELGLQVTDLMMVAEIEFYFDDKPDWSQKVTGFTTRIWQREPVETEEMSPQWFRYHEVPYDQMWPDDKLWLPKVLAGKKVAGEFLFGDNNNVLDYHLRTLKK
jgi:8-oxo-dGTP pyrophosphatase MutT (NUDIX family)